MCPGGVLCDIHVYENYVETLWCAYGMLMVSLARKKANTINVGSDLISERQTINTDLVTGRQYVSKNGLSGILKA